MNFNSNESKESMPKYIPRKLYEKPREREFIKEKRKVANETTCRKWDNIFFDRNKGAGR